MAVANDLISTETLLPGQLEKVLSIAAEGKASAWREQRDYLRGKVIGLLFLNPSLRTRASFQAGVARLGGSCVMLDAGSGLWSLEHRTGAVMNGDKTEHVSEAAGVLSRYFDVLGVRSFPELKSWDEDKTESVLCAFKQHLSIPLINMESAMWHPCQALADALTIRELFGANLKNKKFVLTWANHPKQLPMAVPNSALLIAAQLGMNVTLACPKGYELAAEVLESVSAHCASSSASFEITHSQKEGFHKADIVYAKSWTPPQFVGQATVELEKRIELKDWIVTKELMAQTNQGYFMHCLPVRRNVVVADAVLDSRQSVIFQQAENRMHAQNAWLINLLSKS